MPIHCLEFVLPLAEGWQPVRRRRPVVGVLGELDGALHRGLARAHASVVRPVCLGAVVKILDVFVTLRARGVRCVRLPAWRRCKLSTTFTVF